MLFSSASSVSLRKSATPNVQDDNGYTLLHHATLNGQGYVTIPKSHYALALSYHTIPLHLLNLSPPPLSPSLPPLSSSLTFLSPLSSLPLPLSPLSSLPLPFSSLPLPPSPPFLYPPLLPSSTPLTSLPLPPSPPFLYPPLLPSSTPLSSTPPLLPLSVMWCPSSSPVGPRPSYQTAQVATLCTWPHGRGTWR